MKSSQPARIGRVAVVIAAALLFSCQSKSSDESDSPSAGPEEDAQVFEMRVPAYKQIPAMRIKLGLRGVSEKTFKESRTQLTNYVYLPARDCIGEHGPDQARGRHYVARMEIQNGKTAKFLEYPDEAKNVGQLLAEPVRQCIQKDLEGRKAELATDKTAQVDVHVFIHEKE